MKNINCITIDLGATSGRVILAKAGDGKLEMEVIHRFPNHLLQFNNRYYWNIYSLYENILEGLTLAARKEKEIHSIGVDTWGVDLVYLAHDGSFADLPRAYRDPYTDGAQEKVFEVIPKGEVYRKTGIQFMNFNTLFQLYAAREEGMAGYRHAEKALFMPDAISYMLTGKQVCEYTILSTSQFLNPFTKKIERDFFERLGISADLFPEVVYPGTTIGPLLPAICKATGMPSVPVVAVAGHDTASAIAAIPSATRDFAYISSGTWSLMGIETDEPIVNDESYEMNFTNEGGIDATIRFLKNITGLWLLEQCKKEWDKAGRNYSYQQIVELAGSVVNRTYIDPDHPSFANPASMTNAIVQYCHNSGQKPPISDGEFIRCIFESLALKYATVLESLQRVAPYEIRKLHVIGGGSQNGLLNQFTANAVGMEVIAGPSEATALGNALVQLKALGIYRNRSEMRELLASSPELKRFYPEDSSLWREKLVEFGRATSK